MYHQRRFQTAARAERTVDGLTAHEACEQYQGRILALARRIAERLPPSCELAVDDLCSCGAIGLLEAFKRYDPARNIQFSTFAEYRIRGAMMDALRSSDSFTRYRRQLSRKLEAARHVLLGELGRPPEPQEIAAHLEMDLDEYWNAQDQVMPVHHVSLDGPADGGEEGVSLAEQLVGDLGDQGYKAMAYLEARDALRAAVLALPDRKRHCVLLYYGRGLNLAEVAQVFEVTPSRISQVLSAARKDLRSALKGHITSEELAFRKAQ